MKINKYLLAGLAGLLLAPAAKADFNVYITGSTAFRSAVYTSLKSIFDSGFSVNAGNDEAGGGIACAASNNAPQAPTLDSDFNGKNYFAFSGTIGSSFGSQVVTVYCNWSGSVEGIRDVTQGNSLKFLTTATSQNVANTNASTTAVADFTFSDVFQSTTTYKTPSLQTVQCGVIPFIFTKNNGAPANLTNINHQQAQTLFANGVVALSQITGDLSNGGDTNRVACLIGRYNGSGTRAVFFADTGYGALKSSVNYKYNATANSGSPAFTQVTPDANIGYTSGSSIKTDLGNAISTALGTDGSTYVTGYAIGTLGAKDSYGVTGNSGGALALTYNGVPYSTNAVQNGQYTLWSYEHFYNKSGLSANLSTFKTVLTTAVPNNLGVGTANLTGIPVSAMTVSRNTDGGPIATTY